MLLLHKPKICIHLPNKVGSTSIVRAHFRTGVGELVVGLKYGVVDAPHFARDLDSSWHVIGLHRSPYHRALSLWSHERERNQSGKSFEDFVVQDLICSRGEWYQPLDRFYEGLKVDEWMRLDRIGGLNEYGLDIVWENRGKHLGLAEYDDHSAYLVSLWAYRDFKRWNYPLDVRRHYED